jgi:hypothetical protein
MSPAISRTPNDIWSWPDSLDAHIAAPDHHHLLPENDKIRVLGTRIPPGQIVPVHTRRFAAALFIHSRSDLIRRDQDGIVKCDARELGGKPKRNTPLGQEPLPRHPVDNLGSGDFHAGEVEIVEVEIKDAC